MYPLKSVYSIVSNELITTILTFNQTNINEDPFSYWKKKLNTNFPDTPNRIGSSTVFFAQTESDIATVQDIAKICFETDSNEMLPSCQIEGGILYSLPVLDNYVLLFYEIKELGKGDRFLSFSFPMLESIRQKLMYEEQESHMLKIENIRHEQEIRRLLETINKELFDEKNKSDSFKELLKQVDEHQAELYQNIANTDALLLTLEINEVNFERYLNVLALQKDTLFKPLISRFQFIRQQIDYDLKYIKFLIPGLDKREELLRLNIDWKRKEAEERSNKIKEISNALIFSFGVALGIGQMLFNNPHFDLKGKFVVMVLGGSIAYAINRFVGIEKIKTIWDAFGWPGKVGKEFRE